MAMRITSARRVTGRCMAGGTSHNHRDGSRSEGHIHHLPRQILQQKTIFLYMARKAKTSHSQAGVSDADFTVQKAVCSSIPTAMVPQTS